MEDRAFTLLREYCVKDHEAFAKDAEALLAEYDKRKSEKNITAVWLEEKRSQRQFRREKRAKTLNNRYAKWERESARPHGIDWGVDGSILARNNEGTMKLVWRYGHTSYLNRMSGSAYVPPKLHVLLSGNNFRGYEQMEVTDFLNGTQGNRLCKNTILKYKDGIDFYFGEGAAEKIACLSGTIVVDCQPNLTKWRKE